MVKTDPFVRESCRDFAFEVPNLPRGYDIRIADFSRDGRKWQINIEIDGKSQGWFGAFASFDDALQFVRCNFLPEFPQSVRDSVLTVLAHARSNPVVGITWGRITQLEQVTGSGRGLLDAINQLGAKGLIRVERTTGHSDVGESITVFPGR